MQRKAILQVALDLTEIERAVKIARDAVEGGADWIEAGTPLIKSVGMDAVRRLRREFPKHKIVADMKTIDVGALEVEMAAKAGADVVIILGASHDSAIADAIRAARRYGAEIMVDLMNLENPVKRAEDAERMGAEYLCVHVGIDQQMIGGDPLDVLEKVVGSVRIPVAVAGGLDGERAAAAVRMGASIVIVGGNIVRSANVKEAAMRIRRWIDGIEGEGRRKSVRDEVISILSRVSTPNISDAMHGQPAMRGVKPLFPAKIVGAAVTVRVFEGDWAKAVEAIDVAGRGDVIVIHNSSKDISCWGELASLSAKGKGIVGMVTDGPVRDVEDIVKIGFPVFCAGVAPNAGEPKGLGEINCEIECGGVKVKPGDYIVGDEHGVMVIPRERGLEVARRALEVKKSEERTREEIKEGKTLSEVINLRVWEKVR